MFAYQYYNIMKNDPIREVLLEKLRVELKGHLKQAASYCGIDVSTVSRVLNGINKKDDTLFKLIEFKDLLKSERDAKYLQQITSA